jgi:hypothetical protein
MCMKDPSYITASASLSRVTYSECPKLCAELLINPGCLFPSDLANSIYVKATEVGHNVENCNYRLLLSIFVVVSCLQLL